jgi:hypothetical protein
MAEKSLTKTVDGLDRATDEDFNEDGKPRRPLHLKRGDPRAAEIEGPQKFKTAEKAAPASRKSAK